MSVLSVLELGVPAQTQVTLDPSAAPAAAQAAVTAVGVIGSGFPSGTIPRANVTVTLEPATRGNGPSGTTTATAVTKIFGTSERVTFQIPPSISVSGRTSIDIRERQTRFWGLRGCRLAAHSGWSRLVARRGSSHHYRVRQSQYRQADGLICRITTTRKLACADRSPGSAQCAAQRGCASEWLLLQRLYPLGGPEL